MGLLSGERQQLERRLTLLVNRVWLHALSGGPPMAIGREGLSTRSRSVEQYPMPTVRG
jgi:hypothetical protein